MVQIDDQSPILHHNKREVAAVKILWLTVRNNPTVDTFICYSRLRTTMTRNSLSEVPAGQLPLISQHFSLAIFLT